jgi:hypothetical protein
VTAPAIDISRFRDAFEDIDAVRCELSARTLRHFVYNAWNVVEPAREFIHNWHIDAVCDHMEAVISGVRSHGSSDLG